MGKEEIIHLYIKGSMTRPNYEGGTQAKKPVNLMVIQTRKLSSAWLQEECNSDWL